MLQALTGFGFRDVQFRGVTGEEHRFDAGAGCRSACPCCAREHTSNLWLIKADGPRYRVRNYSQSCQDVQLDCIGRSVQGAAPNGQAPFVEQAHVLAERFGWNQADIPLAGLRDGEVVQFAVRARPTE